MKSSFGKNISVSIWGGSHEPVIGVEITGLPKGSVINIQELESFLKRRAPGNSPFATKRKEPDTPVPVKGLLSTNERFEICDNTISLEIHNQDMRSGDYKELRAVPRPGHADYTARLRYGTSLNMAGGGPFSARMTAPLCIAGGIALQILKEMGITIGAHIYSIANIKDRPFNPVKISPDLLTEVKSKSFPVLDDEAGLAMQEKIKSAAMDCDSVGGVVECCAINIPGGIGGAMYDGVESALAPIFFGIPAVKGVEFGLGFDSTLLKGSENNDAFYYDGHNVKTKTNNHGGILGGITSGMPLISRIAFKATPSISKEQDSVDLDKKENTKLIIKGRHDPCVVFRAVPIVEAALAIGLLDCILEVKND